MRILIFFFSVVIAFFLFNANSGGRAAVKGQGNTGAPGDSRLVCKSCHSGNAIGIDMSIQLLDGNNTVVDKYLPGNEYTVKVKLEPNAGDPRAFGFQMVCLNAELGKDGKDIKNWKDDPKKIYHIADGKNGRTYVEQDKPNRTSGIFNVKWIAPEKGTGTVSFYAAGNGVNLNGSTTGDGASKTSLELKEDIDNAVVELPKNNSNYLELRPNPVLDFLYIHHSIFPSSHLNIHVISPDGQIIINRPYKNGEAIDLRQLNSGVYLVSLVDDKIILASSLMIKK